MNANDLLAQHTCTDNYYRHPLGMLYTDGAKAMADMFQCYWLLDVIASYQHELKDEEFQVWTLGVNADNTAVILCTDGNDNILKTQEIPYTDFNEHAKATTSDAMLWVEGNVILLPSEH